jgi:integrase
MRPRITDRVLTGSRIYKRRKRFALFSKEPIENPRTGKVSKWHSLCLIDDGELRARQLATEIISHNRSAVGQTNMAAHANEYRIQLLKKREKDRPKEPARVKMFDEANKELSRQCRIIGEAFGAFDIEEPQGVDIAKFVDQWEGQRMAQVWMSRLSDFFRWAIRRGLRHDNPCANIRVEKPKARTRYIKDAEWHNARDALMIGEDGKKTQSGPMVRCYVDLCYMLYQRTTEIRLLKWSSIDLDQNIIEFTPTKTEKSSGLSVAVKITEDVREVLLAAKAIAQGNSIYVIHSRKGEPYTANGLGTAWKRACERAGVTGAVLKDIRAKAATDAKKAGFTKEQIRVGLAHTDEGMTETYLRGREAELSQIVLPLPKRPS